MLKSNFSSYLEAGTDEAGRGCLAGPVTAAAIVLNDKFQNKTLTDSKKLSEKQRNLLLPILTAEAISYGIVHIDIETIDRINILNASILAMHGALAKLIPKPEFIIVDGNRFKNFQNIPHQCIVKGDSKYMSIAAASLLAKTHRDAFMEKIHQEFPMYHWNKNKGYPTKEHRAAIRKYGITKYHRKTFRQLPEQLKLNI